MMRRFAQPDEPQTTVITDLASIFGQVLDTQDVGEVRLVESSPRVSPLAALEELLRNRMTSYTAPYWAAYKAALQEVEASHPEIPHTCASPLCLLDEAAVALALDAWHAAYRLGLAIGEASARGGGTAIRPPEHALCDACLGSGVQGGESATPLGPDCPACGGEGVVHVTPHVLVLGSGSGVMPMPVRVVQT